MPMFAPTFTYYLCSDRDREVISITGQVNPTPSGFVFCHTKLCQLKLDCQPPDIICVHSAVVLELP